MSRLRKPYDALNAARPRYVTYKENLRYKYLHPLSTAITLADARYSSFPTKVGDKCVYFREQRNTNNEVTIHEAIIVKLDAAGKRAIIKYVTRKGEVRRARNVDVMSLELYDEEHHLGMIEYGDLFFSLTREGTKPAMSRAKRG